VETWVLLIVSQLKVVAYVNYNLSIAQFTIEPFELAPADKGITTTALIFKAPWLTWPEGFVLRLK